MEFTTKRDIDTFVSDKNLWIDENFKKFILFADQGYSREVSESFNDEEFATEFLKFLLSPMGTSFHYSPPMQKISVQLKSNVKVSPNKSKIIIAAFSTLLNNEDSFTFLLSNLSEISDEYLNIGLSVLLKTHKDDVIYDILNVYFRRYVHGKLSEENKLKITELYKNSPLDIQLKLPPEVAVDILSVEQIEEMSYGHTSKSSYDAFKILCSTNNVSIKKWLNGSLGFIGNSLDMFLNSCTQELTESDWILIFKRLEQAKEEGYGYTPINFRDYPFIPTFDIIKSSGYIYFNIYSLVSRYSLVEANEIDMVNYMYSDYNFMTKFSTEEEILKCPKFFNPKKFGKGYYNVYVSQETFKKLNSFHGLRQKYPVELMTFENIAKGFILQCDNFSMENIKYLASKTSHTNLELYDIFLYNVRKNDDSIENMKWLVSPQGSWRS